MAKKSFTPEQLAEKYARRAKAAVQDMTLGIDNVTEAPGVKAAQKQDKLVQNWNASITSGKWAKGVRSVSLESWKEAMKTKGVGRVAAGVDAAQSKMKDFYAQLIPYQNDALVKLDKMPDLTTEDGVQRAAFWIRQMANFKFNKQG